MRVLLTGATGFAGGFILRRLLAEGMAVRAVARRPIATRAGMELALIDDLASAHWGALCAGVDAVVHAAAYAHDDRADPAMILRTNRDATAALAKAAAAAGARFVFLSSIRAQAGVTASAPLHDDDRPQPDGPYGEAKLAAEAAIAAFCADAVCLRLAPLYGPGVKGNLASLYRLARTGLPLPFGAIRAQRSLLSVETVAELVLTLLQKRRDLCGTFLAAEQGPLSLGEMIATLRGHWGMSARLIPIPANFVRTLCLTLGQPLLWARIGEPLIVSDDIRLRRECSWLFHSTRDGLIRWAGQDQRG
jgi:nucleoside-diphosphate-sugar epimerase